MDVPTMLEIFESYGFETDDELTEDRKVEALNETYWDACGREEWPFLEASATLNYDGSEAEANNDPGDIGQVITVRRFPGGYNMEPWRMDDFYESFSSDLTKGDSPQLYYFEAGALKVYPLPPSSDSLLVKYIRIPDELTATSIESDIQFPKRYHRSVLVVGTLSRLAVMQDDTDLGAAYERLYEKALNTMVKNVFRQQSQRSEFIHVNDPDNWDYS